LRIYQEIFVKLFTANEDKVNNTNKNTYEKIVALSYKFIKIIITLCLNILEKSPNGLSIIGDVGNKCNKIQGIGTGRNVNSSGEKHILHILHNYLGEDNSVFFDVGANIGQYTEALIANFSDRNFSIHAFEPSKSTFLQLTTKLASSNYPFPERIHSNNFALGKNSSEVLLYSDNAMSGLASLTKRRLDHFDIAFEQSEVCRVELLDNYCHLNNISSIDLLKIDVEGHELDVLEGAKNMLSASAISFVQFEFGGCNIDTRTFFQDFFYLFKAYSFEIYRITANGYCQHLPNYSERDEQFRTTNFLAVHQSITFTPDSR
jgi:FkbM family methyltransferase